MRGHSGSEASHEPEPYDHVMCASEVSCREVLFVVRHLDSLSTAYPADKRKHLEGGPDHRRIHSKEGDPQKDDPEEEGWREPERAEDPGSTPIDDSNHTEEGKNKSESHEPEGC